MRRTQDLFSPGGLRTQTQTQTAQLTDPSAHVTYLLLVESALHPHAAKHSVARYFVVRNLVWHSAANRYLQLTTEVLTEVKTVLSSSQLWHSLVRD